MEPIPPGCVAWRAGTKTYSYSVPSPQRLFENSSTDTMAPLLCSYLVSLVYQKKLRLLLAGIGGVCRHWSVKRKRGLPLVH
jgi:hypothetical protein